MKNVLILSVLLVVNNSAMAEAKCDVKGDKNVCGNTAKNLTVNYGISDETVKMIVANFERQHKADAELIKQYAQTIEDLRSGKVDAPASSIQAAFAALEKGDSSLAEALFEKSAEDDLKKALDSNKQAAKALRNLGTLRWWDTQKALKAYQQATQLDPDNADGWNRLAHLFSRIGELDNAIAAYSKVLDLGKTHQNQQEIAAAYGNLGIVYKTRGELDKGIEMYNKGLVIEESLGLKEGMAAKYGNLGNVYQIRGELDKAIEFYQKSLDIKIALGLKEGIANTYGNLGNVYQTRGELDKAIEMYQKSLAITESLGLKETSANQYGNLGNVYKTRGELDKAIEMQKKALAIDESMGNKQGMAAKYGNLGNVYKLKGNKAEAKRYYQKSIELFKYIGSPNAKKAQALLDAL